MFTRNVQSKEVYFSQGPKLKNISSGTTWYALSLVEMLDQLAVAAQDTIDQHFD